MQARVPFGEDHDSEPRQRAAILAGAKRLGLELVYWFYDTGTSGEVPVSDRPGFSTMLDRIHNNGVRVVILAGADRFSRKMLTTELGILLLFSRGVKLITAGGENLTDTDDEMRVRVPPDGYDLCATGEDAPGQEIEAGARSEEQGGWPRQS